VAGRLESGKTEMEGQKGVSLSSELTCLIIIL